jgi:hypothetical protein
MNFLKNLIIIAVLAAVGYGVYVSLSRNTESGQSPSAAPGWPALNVELPTTPSAGTPLNGAAAAPGATLSLSNGTAVGANSTLAPVLAGSAPPVTQASPIGTVASPGPASLPTTAPGTPYPSSTAPSVAVPAAATYPDANASTPPSGMTASPGKRVASGDSLAANSVAAPTTTTAGPVRNLAPPPEVAANAPAAPCVDEVFLAKFKAFMAEVQKSLGQRKYAEALLALSSLHNDPNLPPLPAEQQKQLDDLLGKLAGTVIYSRQHLLEKPYIVQPGDTLEKVAQQYQIPWQLLGRINNLLPPNGDVNDNESKDWRLPAGSEMKGVHGPFEAIVNLSRHELTLMLDGRYAGRFPIGVGRSQPNLEGTYTVREKTPNPTYRGPDGSQFGPGDPQNPLGSAWIGLTDRIGIHGASSPQGIGRDDDRGSICVSNREIQDLFGILSVGSRVTIVR